MLRLSAKLPCRGGWGTFCHSRHLLIFYQPSFIQNQHCGVSPLFVGHSHCPQSPTCLRRGQGDVPAKLSGPVPTAITRAPNVSLGAWVPLSYLSCWWGSDISRKVLPLLTETFTSVVPTPEIQRYWKQPLAPTRHSSMVFLLFLIPSLKVNAILLKIFLGEKFAIILSIKCTLL